MLRLDDAGTLTVQRNVATLAIPSPGSYVLSGKAVFVNVGGGPVAVLCYLDIDGVHSDGSGVTIPSLSLSSVALETAHTYDAAGTVDMYCGAGSSVGIGEIKIVAIKVGKLTLSG